MSRIVLALLCALAPGLLCANTYSFTIEELDNYIERSKSSGDMLSLLIGEKIEERLNEANITLNEGELLFETDIPDKSEGSCSKYYKLHDMHATVRLDSSSSFQFVLDKLDKPIIASADLSGDIDSSGRIKIKAGSKFLGRCFRYYSDKGSFDFDADFHMTLVVKLFLNPEPDPSAGEHAIKITPQVVLEGEFISYAGNLDIHGLDNPFHNALGTVGSVLINTVKQYIERETNGMSVGDVNNYYQTILADKAIELQQDIHNAFDGSPSKTYALPDIDDETLKRIGALLHDTAGFLPVTFDYLKSNKREILYALLIGDRERLKEIIGGSIACQASKPLMLDMPVTALPQGAPFQAIDYAQFCMNAGGAEKLGNAEDGDMVPLDTWTLTPGTRFDIGVSSIGGNYQPYMQRINYLEHEVIDRYVNDAQAISDAMSQCGVNNSIPLDPICMLGLGLSMLTGDFMTVPVYRGDGSCSLEMRVYTKDIAATGLKPLLAIHGGSWKYRGFGFFGLESQISHYTEQGFVVFAPFYRLVGESDGNIECNGKVTWNEITADVEAALDWVKANAPSYGASGPVSVMGQSAGAHLAGWLVTHRPADIDRSLLMYPPTDFRDLVDEYNIGNYANKAGVSAFAGFVGMSIDSVNVNSDAIVENTFPAMVAQNPTDYPESFMLHGVDDDLVPSRQSVRLCNGYAGNVDGSTAVNDGGNPATGTYKRTYRCGERARLHLFAEASHVLDVCVPGVACLAGSDSSQDRIRYSLNEAIHWVHGDVYAPWLVPVITQILLN